MITFKICKSGAEQASDFLLEVIRNGNETAKNNSAFL